MKKSVISILGVITLIMSCSKPTPPPPAPYTNAEIVHLYWTEALKSVLPCPDSLYIFSEEIDSIEDLWNYEDTVMYYIVKADYKYYNEFGAWSRQKDGFVILPGHFLCQGTTDVEAASKFGKIIDGCNYIEYDYFKVFQKIHEDDSLRTARWNVYQDSIKSR